MDAKERLGREPAETLGEVVLAKQSIASVSELIASTLREAIEADGACVTVLRTQLPTVTSCAGDVGRDLDTMQVEHGEGPVVEAALRDTPLVVPSMGREDRWPRFVRTASGKGVTSMLAVPIPSDTSKAALTAYATGDRAFDEDEHLEVALDVARRAGPMLANVSAYEELNEMNAQLREALRSREVIGQATGILIEREGCSADEAFDLLRKLSQRTNTKLRDLARQVVDNAVVRTSTSKPAVTPPEPDDVSRASG